MSDPLSPLASVITVAGCALESIRTLSTILRRFRKAPAQIHEWLAMLESLSSTLLSLQQFGGHLDLTHRFSPNFRQRLRSCVSQLQRSISEIARIHTQLVMRSSDRKKQWDYKARRSWERTKWAIGGDQKMKQVMSLVKMYHFEFVMELLRIVIVAQPTRLLTPSLPAVPSKLPRQQQRLRKLRSDSELQRRPSGLNSCHAIEGAVNTPSAAIRRDFFHAASAHDDPIMQSIAIVPMDQSHIWVNAAVLLHWKIIACTIMIRAGPVMKLRSYACLKAQSEKDKPKRHQQIGLGLTLSLYLPQPFRRPLGLALLTFQAIFTTQTTQTLHWNLHLPRTVSPDAEIFKYTRAGSIHHIQRLLTLQRASATDITLFGTTLLHSAARSGHLQLTRLLIREGADVNAQDEDGESPLHAAMAKSGNYDVARTLIEHGAELSSRAVDGKTPLHSIFNDTIGAVLMRDEWLERLSADAEGMSISHYLAWSSRSTAQTFQRGRLCDATGLLAVDALGRNCLHFAAARGNLGVLEYLVSRAEVGDVGRRDAHGRTPFQYAGGSSREAGVVDVLMKKRWNSCAPDEVGAHHLALGSVVGGADDGRRARGVPALDLCGGRGSREVGQTRGLTLYRHLRGTKSSNTVLLGRWYTRQDSSVAIAGLLILIVMIFLEVPD